MHTPSGYTLFTQCSFDSKKDMLDSFRGKDEGKEVKVF